MSGSVIRSREEAAGFGLVETMVGILIGLVVVLAVYSMLSTAEGYRRTASGAADAQINGILGQFLVSRDAGNGGNGVMLGGDDTVNYLVNCTKREDGSAYAATDADLPKPIPVLIVDGGGDSISDSLIAFSSNSSRVNWPVNFVGADSLAGADFVVQSPTGFTVPLPKDTPYRVIAAANDGTGRCGYFQITDASTPPGAQGQVTLKPSPASTITYTAATAKLINLGPVGQAARIRYDVWNTAADEPCGLTDAARPCQLFRWDLLTAGSTRNPVVGNVVLMKAQYGIDTTATPDGIIDCWTGADNSNTCADGKDYRPSGVQNFSLTDLSRIMAVRVALVVRSDEPDLKDDSLKAANRPDIVLFNCSANDPADPLCKKRIVLPKGNTGQIVADYWRYRSYETVVPLRNSIFVGTL
jgi:type IV pilus assembly protein PilW